MIVVSCSISNLSQGQTISNNISKLKPINLFGLTSLKCIYVLIGATISMTVSQSFWMMSVALAHARPWQAPFPESMPYSHSGPMMWLKGSFQNRINHTIPLFTEESKEVTEYRRCAPSKQMESAQLLCWKKSVNLEGLKWGSRSSVFGSAWFKAALFTV